MNAPGAVHTASRPELQWSIAHSNHEGLHQFLFLFLCLLLILSQFALFWWKKYHYKSFQIVTLFGLWVIPCVLGAISGYIRFILIWILWTGVTAFLLRKASTSPIEKETPKRVYGWFYILYNINYGCAIFGYSLLMLDFLGISLLISEAIGSSFHFAHFGTTLIFYGLYFGVLSRDCAEMCADRMASKMGFTGKGLPKLTLAPSTCCICGDFYDVNQSVQLNCKHRFHDWCIRGWTMIGKKETCPYCSEKVTLRTLFRNPWEQQGIAWGAILDSLRYLIVWNPIILVGIQIVIYFIDPGA